MKASVTLLSAAILGAAAFAPSLQAAPLVVGAGSTVQLGNPKQATSASYNSITIEGGGTLDLQGDATLNVAGDIVIDGTISSTPSSTAPNGPDGTNGVDGLNNQPTGYNGGTFGTYAGTAPGGKGASPQLTLIAGGTLRINGTIRLEAASNGGNGGRGGNGGNGGSGKPGAEGGGGAQGGTGGDGGFAGSGGGNLTLRAQSIDLAPGGSIELDSKSVGGKGGPGGNGGNGGPGGEAARGGDGGFPGGGGMGGVGGTGGTVNFVADTVVLDGQVSVRGSNGGDGGPIGTPGNGGDGGAEPPGGKRGGDGGNAAGAFFTGGITGGNGGPGGNGGLVRIQANDWSVSGTILLDGGQGGVGGPGVPAGRGQGGTGGPGAANGLDSQRFPDGQNGPSGQQGRIVLVPRWDVSLQWNVSGPLTCIEPFTAVLDKTNTLQGIQLCDGTCLSSLVTVNPDQAYELTFDYRWLTTDGTLEFHLGGAPIVAVDASASLSDQFKSKRVLITDPAILSGFSKPLEVCVLSNGSAVVQVANLSFRAVTTNPPPAVSIRLGAGQSPLEFSWYGVTGQAYQLQTRASLTAGNWTNIGPSLQGTGGPLTANAAMAAGQSEAFFRVLASPSQ